MVGYLLILSIIILGGVIATLGDRIGSRVGKARLSLFNLRPKKTAVLITILTGSVTSATTMGILLATNGQLRDAIFRIGTIQRQLRTFRAERDEVLQQKNQSEDELAIARAELTESVRRLRAVNRTLRTSVSRQRKSEAKLQQFQARFREAQNTLRKSTTQARVLRSKISRLVSEERQIQAERQRLLQQRNQTQKRLQGVEAQRRRLADAIATARTQLQQAEVQQQQFEAAVVEAQAQLQQANAQRGDLLQQRSQLQKDVATLERNRQRLERNVEALLIGLRRGNITIRTGQVLSSGVVEDIDTREEALEVLNTLLRQARTAAIVLINPPDLAPDQQVVQITSQSVERVVSQVSDGKPYLIRILAAANYLEGEETVLVAPQLAVNRLVLESEETLAVTSLTPEALSDEQILNRLNILFSDANQQAIQSGVLPDPLTGTVGSFQQIELFRFVLALKDRNDNTPVSIQAIAPNPVFTAGPLVLQLVALKGQEVILRSGDPATP
ncbi:Chromosome partition protein Smc [Acaryochloris thomasi RCC1774]|uniref:Chromosome partition protein Smc n=1 Tax=Acaryochloris thomasi RCC1774 TaxID=1764569 RepID=A0A2W1JIZ9_9CYAN|nr:DUF3084 domain-containing protein [Acaryochloris thomasi]PZD73439.1 Chromosome partition protein Smc [Acaryochloris thomasi RCC1774]